MFHSYIELLEGINPNHIHRMSTLVTRMHPMKSPFHPTKNGEFPGRLALRLPGSRDLLKKISSGLIRDGFFRGKSWKDDGKSGQTMGKTQENSRENHPNSWETKWEK